MDKDLEFDTYGIDIDVDCISDDFDNYDLYGERMVEEEYDECLDNIQFE